jgi:epoxide hydrolase-like predicted phosphatase
MTIKTIFWDIGGVLERTEDHTPREALAAKLGYSTRDLAHLIFGHSDQYRIQLGQISWEEHFANIAIALNIPEDSVKDVLADFFAHDRLDRELVDFIRTLKQDHTIAVISNYTNILRGKINDLWQIGDIFDELIISAEVGVMKPDPGIFQIALARTASLPEEAVFIDDFIENVEGAKNVGMHAILFETPGQTIQNLNTLINTAKGNH